MKTNDIAEGLTAEEAALFEQMREMAPMPLSPARHCYSVNSEIDTYREWVKTSPGSKTEWGPAKRRHDFAILRNGPEGCWVGKVTFEPPSPNRSLRHPETENTFSDSPDSEITATEFLQMMMDLAWAKGFRPSADRR
jgi:hypothetical protein